MEAVACRFAMVHDLLSPYASPDHEVVATGRALLSSPLWMQITADVLNRPVIASTEAEASSRGAALLALEALGAVKSVEDLPARLGQVFRPVPERRQVYMQALARQRRWYEAAVSDAGPPWGSDMNDQ